MSDVNKQLMEALEKISRMTMGMYLNAHEVMRDAKRIAHEAIDAAEQAQRASSKCATCRGVGIIGHSDVCMDCIDTWQTDDSPEQQDEPLCIANPSPEQLYTMVTSRFKSGTFPWSMVSVSGKEAWAAAAAELVFAPDTIMASHAPQPAQPPAVPDGYVLVPIEPTQAMLCAGQKEWLESAGADPSFDMYRAMLSAAQEGGK